MYGNSKKMSDRKKLHIGMSLAPTWLSGEGWRRADAPADGMFGSELYLDVAKRAEAAKMDFVFRPDTLFLHPEALGTGHGFASLDPTVLLAALARETSHIGLLTTISSTFFPPYVVARQLQSLNWLSGGRAGWNIVTALEGNQNFGLTDMPSSQERYARAAEFVQLVTDLWASFPNEALKFDKQSGLYADAAQVHEVAHKGDYYSVQGPLNVPAFEKVNGNGRIPLVQAGASATGRRFAASIADAIFASTPDREAAVELRADLRRLAVNAGREADDIRVLPGLSLYLAPTRAEARDLFTATHARLDKARKFASVKEMVGIDLSDWPEDKPVTTSDLPAPPATVRSRTHADLLRRLIERDSPTPAELLTRPEVVGSAHWQVIGTVSDAVDEIKAWAAAGAMDGFIALPGGSVDCMRSVMDDLVPTLTDEGLFRRDYDGATFIGHLTQA